MATANSIDALNPEMWSATMQEHLRKSLVALDICSVELSKELKVGDVIHKPYVSPTTAAVYTPGTDIVVTGITATDDGISASVFNVAPFYVDDVRMLQTHYSYAADLAEDAAYQLRDNIDQLVLAYGSAAGVSALGYSGDGATAFITTGDTGTVTAIAATTASNISAGVLNIFKHSRKWLQKGNVKEHGDWIAVVEPGVAANIAELAIEKGFNLADSTLRNGYAGDFLGFHVYVSNNLPADKAIIGKRGAIDLILQQDVKMEIKEEPKKLGKNFIPWTVYGAGILTKNKLRTINVMCTD